MERQRAVRAKSKAVRKKKRGGCGGEKEIEKVRAEEEKQEWRFTGGRLGASVIEHKAGKRAK